MLLSTQTEAFDFEFQDFKILEQQALSGFQLTWLDRQFADR